MTKESLIFFFGALILITPHVGIPENWKFYIYTATGAVLMIVGYSLRRKSYIRSIEKEDGERDTDSFSESTGNSNNIQ